MTPIPRQTTGHLARTILAGRVFSVTLALLPALTHAATALQLGIAPPSSANEFNPTAYLTWDAQPGCIYTVQSSTTLGDASQWVTEEPVLATDATAGWMAREPVSGSKFYRLVLPQPQIFSVVPTLLAPGVAANVSIIGQAFDSSVTLLINGVAQTPIVILSPSLLAAPPFTPDVPGTYLFELVVGGQVVSSFQVTCADPLANPELVLQGPPEEPPASAKTKDEARIKADRAKYGNLNLLRTIGGDDIRENDNVVFEVQEGKKGLNAVNVKLARMAGGSGIRENDEVVFDVQEGKKGLNAVNVKTARMAGGDGGGTNQLSAGRGWVDTRHAICWTAVMPFSGEVQQQVADLAVAGRGLDFVWARSYHSRLGRFDASANGWSFSYDVRCAHNSSGGIDLYDGTGRKDTFKPQANGTYTCPEFFREGTFSNTTFTLTFADTGRWVFHPFDGTATAGKLEQIVDRNGNTITLGYDTAGHLTQIVDDLGRTNTVAYNTAGQLASVTDFSGRSVTYAYYQSGDTGGCPGDLKSVTSPPVTGTPNKNDFPLGKTTTYTYSTGYANAAENHLLLAVIDATGQTIYTHVYQHNQTDLEFLRCISVQRGTDPPAMLSYLPQTPTPANQFATLRCVINDPLGDVTEEFFDARNRCVTAREFTGRATPGVAVTATANRPANKLRAGDRDYYETRWIWNNDSLCTLEVTPGGQQLQCVYQFDFDPATRACKRADCRVLREIASSAVDLNGDGVPDVTERSWHFDYDPRFGSDPTPSFGKKLYVGNLPFSSSDAARQGGGSDGSTNQWPVLPLMARGIIASRPGGGSTGLSARKSKGIILCPPTSCASRAGSESQQQQSAKIITDRDSGRSKGFGFVISATDPRGYVMNATYDATGNRVKVKFPWLPGAEADFTYDTNGQLTSVTNAADANGRRSVDTFAYAQGQLVTHVEDAGGLNLTTSNEYDAHGNLTRAVDELGNDCLFTYNALDQCVRAQSPVNVSARCATDFSYDANDNLVQCSVEVRDAADTILGNKNSTFTYDAHNRLIRVTEPVSGKSNAVTEFSYDANDQVTLMRAPEAVNGNNPANTVAWQYDERRHLFRTIGAPDSSIQSTVQCDYDANANLTRVSDGLEGTPGVTLMEYDGFAGFGADPPPIPEVAFTVSEAKPMAPRESIRPFTGGRRDRIAKITDPTGNVASFNYDANDNLKVVRQFGQAPGLPGGLRLAESRYEYDGLDRRVVVHDLHFSPATQAPVGDGEATTRIAFAPCGQCRSATDDRGHTTAYAYDTAGRLASVTSPGGSKLLACVRDAAGRPTTIFQTFLSNTDVSQFSITNAFDPLGRCISSTDNVGNSSSCAYDSLGRVVRATDPNGNDSTFAYDLLGNCLTSTDFTGSSSGQPTTVIRSNHAAYDLNSRCLTSTDGNGNTTAYAYDSLDRLVAITHADGTHHSLVWSPRSNLIGETDANGTVVTNTYDGCDRLIHRDIAVHGAAMATTTFETYAYDGCSRLVLASNDVSSLAIAYDSLGNALSSTQDGLTTTCTFDGTGNCLSMTYPSGRIVTYSYNALDCVTNIGTTKDGIAFPALTSIGYAGDHVVSLTRANGINTRLDWDGRINPANAAGDSGWQQISRISHGNASVLEDLSSSYSPAQSKATQSNAVGGRSTTLSYDALQRLVGSSLHLTGTPALDTAYALDADGNRTRVTSNGGAAQDYTMSSALPPGDSQMNRYSTTPFGTQTYDANGNLLQRTSASGPTFYHYDYADRLVEVDALNGDGVAAPLASFSYDALGQRISKTTYPGAPPAPVTVQYVRSVGASLHNGLYLHLPTAAGRRARGILETRVLGEVSEIFVHSTGLKEEIRENDTLVFETGRDGMPDVIAAFTAAGAVRYYHSDELGNTLALTDSAGVLLERCTYDDYGQPQFFAADGTPVSASPSGNPFLFHGMEWDDETGLYHESGGAGQNPLYQDPKTGRSISAAGGGAFGNNNPWGGGGGTEMKNGTVKFFNESKGFGFNRAGSGHTSNAAQGINSPNLILQ